MRVLVADADTEVAEREKSILERDLSEVSSVSCANTLQTMIEGIRSIQPDVVLVNENITEDSAESLIKTIRSIQPTAIILLKGDCPEFDSPTPPIKSGALDCLRTPVGTNALLRSMTHATAVKALEDDNRRLCMELLKSKNMLEQRVRELMLENDIKIDKLNSTMERMVYAMASAIEIRDPWTYGHQKRVASVARAIAQALDLPEDTVKVVYLGSLVHDLGKLQVPAEILSYPGKLGSEEMAIIKRHPLIAQSLLKEIGLPWPVDRIASQHHERLDGSGYPQGLKGDEILIEARIVAVADVLEAMASHRPYRAALGIEAAWDEINRNKGILYDPDVVDACGRVSLQEVLRSG